MKIIYPTDPLDLKKVDTEYEREYNVAQELGFELLLINYEELVYNQNPIGAITRIKPSDNIEEALYRGWMVKPEDYTHLYNELKNKNIELINSPENYKLCHYLPEYYNIIQNYTPETIWFKEEQFSESSDEVYNTVRKTFGSSPIIIKDYVKSCKHEWEEACFIPSASDIDKVKKVVNRFLELQGEDLNKGLVFREFIKLEFLALHSKSKMPLTKEFRLFFLNRELLQVFHYWDEGDYEGTKPDLQEFMEIAKKIDSQFFTMDIARIENGPWIIIEIGDGQVSGLPDKADLQEFYGKLDTF